jgi:hypothetical protein
MTLYIEQFLIGIALEAPVLYYFLRDRDLEDVLAATLALNTVTHPLLLYVVPLIEVNYILSLFVSEIAVIAVEMYLLSFLFEQGSRRTFFKASILANLASWQLAPFLLYLLSLLP